MADVASLALEVRSDQVTQATAALRQLPPAASAAERAAQKWSATTQEAGRSAEDFSRRVRKTIADLEFERQQLARNATEQARFIALRRAGVAASSAEGIAITAGVRALQAQEAAYERTTARAEAFKKAKTGIGIVLGLATAALTLFGKAAFDTASGMDELSEQVGLSAQTFQALQYAASQSGVKTEQLETGLTKFTQKMGEAAEGSKDMVESLTKLGVKNLDVQGNLRPTEDLLVDVAKAITSIDDPAKRAAAAVDFFGRAGTKMLPMLEQMAAGTNAMAQSAQLAGAIISEDTTKKLDVFADDLAKLSQRTKVWAAEMMGWIIDGMAAFREWRLRTDAEIKAWISEQIAGISKFADGLAVEGARASAMFIEAFRQAPEQLRKVFVDMWDGVKAVTVGGINDLTAYIASTKLGKLLGVEGSNLKGDPSAGGGADFGGLGSRITAAGKAAADKIAAEQKAAADASAIAAGQSAAGGIQGRGAARGPYLPPGAAPTVGAGTSAVKASGSAAEDAEKKYAKLIGTLDLTVAAQDKMTAAARAGETQFEKVKIQLEAQQKAFEIYGKVLDATDPKLKAIEDRLTAISQGKAAEAFNTATIELGRQNEIMEAQIRLMNERPEIQAREIALIRVKHEAEKAGKAITQDDLAARLKVVDVNERLKIQAEELKAAQELWTAPLKRALEDIQSTAADAFEQMLQSGKFNFEELGKVFKSIITRMAAEFLALATIRPIMNVVVNAVSGSGGGGMSGGGGGAGGIGDLIGQGMKLFGGGSNGGGSLFDMFGGGMFGTTVGGANAAGVTAVGAPIGGYSATLGANGLGTTTSALGGSMSGASASGGFTGAMGGAGSMAGMAGGALGLGMGALSLASGGTKTTKGTIAGVGQMVGGALMMIPTGYTQIAGAIIMALSSILPGLMGDENKITYDREYGELQYGAGGFTTSGGAWGADANAKNLEGPLGKVGQNMDAIFKAFGGVKDAGKVWGIALQSYKETYSAGGSFANATSFLVGPNGERRQWGMGSLDSPGDIGMESAAITATINSILDGAVGAISKNMRKAFEDLNSSGKATFQLLSTAVAEVMGLDEAIKNFGRTITAAEEALAGIDKEMDALYGIADKYGLDKEPLNAEKARLRTKLGTDFGDALDRELMDPLTRALTEIGDERTTLTRENSGLMAIEGYLSQQAKIEEIYMRKRTAIIEEHTARQLAIAEEAAAKQRALQQDMINTVTASVMRAQDLIRQLSPGGALGNVDPRSQLAGLRATYTASLAQAMASPLDQAMVARAVEDAQAFAETSLRFNAGSAAYERDRQMVLQQQQQLQGAVTNAGMSGATDPALKALLQQLLGLTQTNIDPERDAKMTSLINLLLRFFADKAAA